MIAEAVDTAFTLGWALAAWIVLTAGVAVLALYAVVAIVWGAVRATVRGVVATRSLLYASVTHEQATDASPLPREAHKPPEGPSRPSWAHTDKEAA